MRTTVNLPDELYRAVRVKAAEEGRTVTSILEEALRKVLAEAADERSAYRVRPLKGDTTAADDLPLDDNAAMRDLMEDDDA
ncbi:ribbon-helix-helix protein, CopG family [Haloactinopolyspora sp.]|uniref:ribbon-helix-helix protein, CopG family n=1 Tax=Haloactinopolyspora sp. TaxID=1966353 RepID=UPI002633793F|nr:ribbon-helix-helix protein, CopG family [Haloactinopolyspora sp.]